MKSRETELTAIHNRNLFDEPPYGCASDYDLARWDRFRMRYHAAQTLEHQQSFPLQVDFELNSHCNMRCSFCLHGEQTIKKHLMPMEVYRKAIDECYEHELVSIKLNYINEPLLRADLPEAIVYARKRGVLNTFFATNGTLLTEETAYNLIDAGLSKLMVSLDAVSPETFLVMRQSGKFDQIVRNIETFLDVRNRLRVSHPLLRVNFLKTPRNSHEAEDFYAYWKDRADMIGFQDQVAVPGAANNEFLLSKDPEAFACSFPFKLVAITSHGDISPCCTFSGRGMPLGNLSDTTIEQAWRSDAMRRLREQHHARTWERNPHCRTCILGETTPDVVTING